MLINQKDDDIEDFKVEKQVIVIHTKIGQADTEKCILAMTFMPSAPKQGKKFNLFTSHTKTMYFNSKRRRT